MPVKISQLPASTNPPNTADLLPIVQGGITKQTTLGALFTQLLGFLPSGIGGIARTVSAKLLEAPKSPADYTSGIQQAVNTGGFVKLPTGATTSAAAITGLSGVTLQGDSKGNSSIAFTTASARGLDMTGALRAVVNDLTLTPPGSPTNLAMYADTSQELTFSRVKAVGWDGGFQFLMSGALSGSSFNNIATLDQVSVAGSLTKPNLDWAGLNLHCRGCDFSSLPPSGTRAAVRIRSTSYDSTFENTHYEHGSLAAGGNVFQCEGGLTRIKGGHAQGGADGTKRVGAFVAASGGAIVIIEGMTGFNYWTNLVTADGAGTIVYIMPGGFLGSFDVTTRYVETNGGKVVDLSTLDAKTTDVTFAAGNFTGDGTITWTVASQLAYYYLQVGKMMTVWWHVQNSSTGGTASNVLNIAVPNSKVVNKRAVGVFDFKDNGTEGKGMCDVLASGTVIRLTKGLTFANWSNASVNATDVAGQLTFEVQ